MVDFFFGKLVGKYTSPLDGMGMLSIILPLLGVRFAKSFILPSSFFPKVSRSCENSALSRISHVFVFFLSECCMAQRFVVQFPMFLVG